MFTWYLPSCNREEIYCPASVPDLEDVKKENLFTNMDAWFDHLIKMTHSHQIFQSSQRSLLEVGTAWQKVAWATISLSKEMLQLLQSSNTRPSGKGSFKPLTHLKHLFHKKAATTVCLNIYKHLLMLYVHRYYTYKYSKMVDKTGIIHLQ